MDDILTPARRVVWGVLGGAAAVVTKLVSQDLYWVQVHLDTLQYVRIVNLAIIYILALIGLCFVGGLIAAATHENNRIKLLALAVAAPALFTTAAGGTRPDYSRLRMASINFIQPAAAAETVQSARSQGISVTDGLKQFFGIGRDTSRYRVVVGSYKDASEAAIIAERLKKAISNQPVYVGERQPGNEYYPVVIGGFQPYPEASALKDKAVEATGVKDTYLSPYTGR